MDLLNDDKLVAIKTEQLNQPYSHLLREIQSLKAFEGSTGFPALVK